MYSPVEKDGHKERKYKSNMFNQTIGTITAEFMRGAVMLKALVQSVSTVIMKIMMMYGKY